MHPLAEHAFTFTIGRDWVGLLVALVVTALFVYVAARIILDRSSFVSAILTVLVGNFLAGLVLLLVGGIWGLVLGALAWGLVAALFFRTAWLKGVVIGVVAWLLWALVVWLISLVTG